MSLYSDLNEVLTPYAQRIKGLSAANEEIKADLGAFAEPSRLDNGTDLNNVMTPGVYLLHTNNTYENKPTSDAEHGILEVWDEKMPNNAGRIFQRLTYTFKTGRTSGEIWTRLYSRQSQSWIPWVSASNTSINDVEFTDPVKLALVDIAENVYYKVHNGRTLCNALITALYTDAYPRLKVVFAPGSTPITTGASLSDLHQYLTVTYYATQKSAGTIITSENYTLSGDLDDGINIITVTYNGVVGSFLVNVVGSEYYNTFTWKWTSSESTFNIALINGIHRVSNINGIVGITIPSNSGTKRKVLLATRGTIKLNDQNGNETQYYMIPVPPTATRASVSVTPNTLTPGLLVAKKEGNSYKYTAESGWGSSGGASRAINPGNDQFVLVVVKHGTSDATVPNPTKCTLTFTT